jgi:integrase
MARRSKTTTIDYSVTHDLSRDLLAASVCPPDKPFVLLKDKLEAGLRLRVTKAGGKHWQFETRVKGKLFTRSLGKWDAVSIGEAQSEAHRLRGLTGKKQDPRDLERQHKEAEAAEAAAADAKLEAEMLATVAANAALVEAEKYNLENLLTTYCDNQRALGRKSHADARSIFKLHIIDSWPKVAALPANLITPEQIADMMRRVIELGKGRTANKLRSYVRAAYQVAKASRTKASIPVAFKSFNVRSNPASDTEPDESANKPDKNPLSAEEMRIYWRALRNIEGFPGALLRLHLLTGGQRLEQLVQLQTADVMDDSILLYDGKGRPGKLARPHQVPLTHEATVALIECEPKGQFALSTDGGITHVSAATLSEWAMQAGSEIEGFKTKRIRSGVETLLASARISEEHRGRLQSHGISGVQNRHYDGHNYMDEKRDALTTLLRLLTNEPVKNVLPFKAA